MSDQNLQMKVENPEAIPLESLQSKPDPTQKQTETLNLEVSHKPSPKSKLSNKKTIFFIIIFFLCYVCVPLGLYYFITSQIHEHYYMKKLTIQTDQGHNISLKLDVFYNGSDSFYDYLMLNVSSLNSNNESIGFCQNLIIRNKLDFSVSSYYKCDNDQNFTFLNGTSISNNTIGIYASDEITPKEEKRILGSKSGHSNSKSSSSKGSSSSSKGSSSSSSKGSSSSSSSSSSKGSSSSSGSSSTGSSSSSGSSSKTSSSSSSSSQTSSSSGSSGSLSQTSSSQSKCTTITGYGHYKFNSCSGEVTAAGSYKKMEAEGSCQCQCDELEGDGAYSYQVCN